MTIKVPNTSSTALRILAVLEYVAEARRPVTVVDVCTSTGLDRPTAYRALLTLVEAGFVLRGSGTKTYALSHKIVTLARHMLSPDSRSEAIRATLRKIVEATGETCHYSVLEGFETVTTLREKGDQIVAVEFKIGDRGQLHATSIGKALLAYQDDDYIETALLRPMPRLTSHTIISSEVLRRELEKVRSCGLATDDHEMIEGMRCVAVPIFDGRSKVTSGLSMSGPSSRYTDDYLRRLGAVLIHQASELSELLAGRPSTTC